MVKTLAELAQSQRSLADILTGIGQRGTNAVRQVSGGIRSLEQHIMDNRANALAGLPNAPVTTRSGVPFPSERQFMENILNAGEWAGGGGIGGTTKIEKGMKLFHGTEKQFDNFDPKKLGSGFGGQDTKYGFFASDNPKVAESYIKNPFGPGHKPGGNIRPLKLDTDNFQTVDIAGTEYGRIDKKYLNSKIAEARDSGHEALVLKNIKDTSSGKSVASNVVIFFNPAAVKSAFANHAGLIVGSGAGWVAVRQSE